MFSPEYSSRHLAGKLFTCGVTSVIWAELCHFYKQNAIRESALPEQVTLKLRSGTARDLPAGVWYPNFAKRV